MSGGEFGQCRNWMAIPHEKLYDDIHSGRGAAANEGALSSYEEIGALFAEVQDDIARGISMIRGGYEGDGSDAAQNAISGLEAWTADAQTGASLAGQNVQTQTDGYVQAKNSMPEPVTYNGWQTAGATVADVLIGGPVVREYLEAQQREAHMQAAQVMGGYDATAGSAALSMPTFVPPAPTTVQVAEPSPGQSPVGALAGSVTQAGGFAGGGGSGGGGGATPVSTFGGMTGGAGAGSPSRYSPGAGGGVPAGGAPAAGTGPARSGPGAGGATGGSGPGRSGPGAGGAGEVPFVPGGYRTGAGGSGSGAGRAGGPYRPGAGGAAGAGRYGGAGGTLGRGFGPSGSGAGEGFGGRGAGSGGGGLGRGPAFGAGAAGMADDMAPGRGAGGAGAGGRGFGGAVAPFMGGAGRGRGGDDIEHQRPSYLVETDDIWGDGRKVAPPVIGEDPPR